MPDPSQLAEVVQQIKDLKIDPAMIPGAVGIVQYMEQNGLSAEDVGSALIAAVPQAPVLPAPEDNAPVFAYLQYCDDSNIPPIPDAISAVLSAIVAADYAATMAALMNLFRADLKARPHVAAKFAQQVADAESARPKPEPLPIEPAEPIEEMKP